jgi:hypothetical protein
MYVIVWLLSSIRFSILGAWACRLSGYLLNVCIHAVVWPKAQSLVLLYVCISCGCFATLFVKTLVDWPTKLTLSNASLCHGSYIASCGDGTQIHVGPTDCRSYRWSGAMIIFRCLISKSYVCKFMHLPYQLNLWQHIGFHPWNFLNPSPTFSSLKMFTSLDLILWSNRTKSCGNLSFCPHFGER